MKKIVQFLFCTLIILGMTGCGGEKVSTKYSVNSYLKHYFPGEKFKILSVENIIADGELCAKKENGKSWRVKSLSTNVIFTVKDAMVYNLFTCNPKVKNNYAEKMLEKLKMENDDDRIVYTKDEINFDKDDFSNYEEFVSAIYNEIVKINSQPPFKYNDGIGYTVGVRLSSNAEMPIHPFTIKNIDDIKKEIEPVMEKYNISY